MLGLVQVRSPNPVAQVLLPTRLAKVRNRDCHHHNPFNKAIVDTQVTSVRWAALRSTEAGSVDLEGATPPVLRVTSKAAAMVTTTTTAPDSPTRTARTVVVDGAATTATKETGTPMFQLTTLAIQPLTTQTLSTFVDDFSHWAHGKLYYQAI